ncbi:hypothetical protein ANANG_G00071820 [Anguilla anguilla]|uniref:ZP domain-containing protein n=1 Tax=Anguilla anguilla TaxID=7936 RepID=A0A9D3MSV3_ANGAN|nr:hypothetical protein ANANG_G00071820 [Anguilla anguilla]
MQGFIGARILLPIECHRTRRQRGRGETVRPTWKSFTSTVRGAGLLRFSLRVMTEDWSGPRNSTVFQQGEPVNLEAAVDGQWHPPLWIYVDRCVATLSSDPLSEPSYDIISNHGCLTDSRFSGSSSRFFPRGRRNALRFRIRGLLSLGNSPEQQIFVSCHLRAALAESPSDPLNKACFFHPDSDSWRAADGDGAVCRCCETGDCSSWMPVEADGVPGEADGVPKTPLASEGVMDTAVGPLHAQLRSDWRGLLSISDALRPH